MKYLSIREWSRFQHYKDRNPPWIKLHREFLTSYTWVVLDDASRLLAIVCMILASETDNKIPLDRDFIQRRALLKSPPDIRPLVEVGFAEIVSDESVTDFVVTVLADASKPLANDTECLTRDRDRVETEKRREERSLRTFVRPTLQEVSEYCKERNNQVDPSKWMDYYTSNGFKVGRSSMKDWKSSVRLWEKNNFSNGVTNGRNASYQPTRTEQRIAKSRDAILDGLGIRPEPRPSQPNVRNGTATGTGTSVAKLLQG